MSANFGAWLTNRYFYYTLFPTAMQVQLHGGDRGAPIPSTFLGRTSKPNTTNAGYIYDGTLLDSKNIAVRRTHQHEGRSARIKHDRRGYRNR